MNILVCSREDTELIKKPTKHILIIDLFVFERYFQIFQYRASLDELDDIFIL